jgi:hypothetical protein
MLGHRTGGIDVVQNLGAVEGAAMSLSGLRGGILRTSFT